MNDIQLRNISRDHLREHLNSYLAVGADFSPWTAENFLKELPLKWELSFALWKSALIAYCIMSKRSGVAHIHHLIVAKPYRCQGLGARMLTEARRIAGGRITLKIHPGNIRARKFYERHGFNLVGDENGYLILSSH
jgi:ribosomal protein S18 acetylase RimI-like enzyme